MPVFCSLLIPLLSVIIYLFLGGILKNRYGITPWGKWFIDVLDSYEMGARLDRGRSYANTGKVSSLEFKDGQATAKVKGHYRPFYNVKITFPPLKNAEQVYRMIEEDPMLLALIAAGELPESFLQKLKDKGIDLIPQKWKEMDRKCNCPDWGDPCKHMAALYYVIAREIDADPHVLFRLRGMDLAARFGKAAGLPLSSGTPVRPFLMEENLFQHNKTVGNGLRPLPLPGRPGSPAKTPCLYWRSFCPGQAFLPSCSCLGHQ